MCGDKLFEKGNSQELMNLLGAEGTLDGLVKTNGVKRHGRILRRDNDDVLKRKLDVEEEGRRRRGRTNVTWKRQVEENIKQI